MSSRNFLFVTPALSQVNREMFEDPRIRFAVVADYDQSYPEERFQVLVEFTRKYSEGYARSITGIVDGLIRPIAPHESFSELWRLRAAMVELEVIGVVGARKKGYLAGRNLDRKTYGRRKYEA